MRVALCATRQIDRAATNHQDREDEDQQAERIGGDRSWVNSHARCDEKDGNQQTEGQALELVFQRFITIGECSAEHKTCRECTKHDIEIEGYG